MDAKLINVYVNCRCLVKLHKIKTQESGTNVKDVKTETFLHKCTCTCFGWTVMTQFFRAAATKYRFSPHNVFFYHKSLFCQPVNNRWGMEVGVECPERVRGEAAAWKSSVSESCSELSCWITSIFNTDIVPSLAYVRKQAKTLLTRFISSCWVVGLIPFSHSDRLRGQLFLWTHMESV